MVDIYRSDCQSLEAGTKAARKDLTKACLWVAGGLTGLAVGLTVPGANLVALVGFGAFFKGWRDSYGALATVRACKSEHAYYQKKLDDSTRVLDEMKTLLHQARTALNAGKAEDEVRLLSEGIKRTSAIFETPTEVHMPGVRLKKRG